MAAALPELSTFKVGSDSSLSPGFEIVDFNALDPDQIQILFREFKFFCTRMPESLSNRKVCTLIARSLETDDSLPEFIGMVEVRRCSNRLGNLYFFEQGDDSTPLKYENTCRLESVEVAPHWQRRGVGTSLVVNAMKKAASVGLEYMQTLHRSWSEELEKDALDPNFFSQELKKKL